MCVCVSERQLRRMKIAKATILQFPSTAAQRLHLVFVQKALGKHMALAIAMGFLIDTRKRYVLAVVSTANDEPL